MSAPLGQRKSIERAECRKERLDGSPSPLVHVKSHWTAVEGSDQPRAILRADRDRAHRSAEVFFEQRKVVPHRLVDYVAAEAVELGGGGQRTTRHPIDNCDGTDIGIGVGGRDSFAPGRQLNGQQCRLVVAPSQVRELWRQHASSPADASIREQLLATPSALDVLIALLYDDRLAKSGAWPATDQERTQLRRVATALLETSWPLEDVRSAARKNIQLLSRIETIPLRWDERPIAPLLASLRHSLDPVDRELLSWFAESAKDSPAELALQLMPNGFRDRARDSMTADWKTLPEHDYVPTYYKCLDPDRPKTLLQAAYLLPRGRKTTEALEQLLAGPLKSETRHSLCSSLLHFNKKAREYFVELLSHEDEALFQEAANQLAVSMGYGDDFPLVPRLKRILDGEDQARRQFLLRRMGNLRGPGAGPIAELLATHLLADDWRERGLAAEALLRLEHGGPSSYAATPVLRKVGEKSADPRIQKLCRQLLEAPNQTLKELSGQLQAPPPSPGPVVTAHQRAELTKTWRELSGQSSPAAREQDAAAKDRLLRAGEAALEVMLDLVYGSCPELSDEQFAELLQQLGADEFAKREAASAELQAAGENVRTRLEKNLNHDDPEVRKRISRLLVQLSDSKLAEHDLDRLRRAATDMLIRDWPLDQQRQVTKRRLQCLAKIKTVPHVVMSRPAQVLFASLRYSEIPADRELLAEVILKAEPGAAEMCMLVMRNGIDNWSDVDMYSDWRRVPYYDYEEVNWRFLDPTQPDLFQTALYHIQDKEQLASKLREFLKQPLTAEIQEIVHGYLWHWHGDAASAEYYAAKLRSEDEQEFETGLNRLTDSHHSYRGKLVIPMLLPLLQGDDDGRRLRVLEELKGYLGADSVTLAADTAAPFLASRYSDEREAAKKVLLRLQNTGWVDVLQRIAEKGASEPVRGAAAALRRDWSSSKEKKN
ncbi:MAG: hypothetical protein K2Y37_18990 [Pirellulales bacterium]|nr:hypothetical protein [Pirellulales bacterium]